MTDLVLVTLTIALVALTSIPLGRDLARIFAGENRLTQRILGPVERLFYRAAGIDSTRERDWMQYALATLAFSAVTELVTYGVMRLQASLPFNAVFLAGLMVGRTPGSLGKKIDRRDVRFASIDTLLPAFLIFTALAALTEAGRAGIFNTSAGDIPGAPWHPHGLSEVLDAYSSATGNNGSAFAGLTAYSAAHPVFYSLTLALAMFVGRFPLIVAVLALAGNMARKKLCPPGPGTFPVDGALFVALLVVVIVIVGALTFFPALSLSPIVEHLTLR